MDIRLLMEIRRKIEALETGAQKLQAITLAMQERYIIQDIRDEYNREAHAWHNFEDSCYDWYMDSCHFWDENHFHLLFDDSTPPSVEHILERRQELSMHTLLHFYYSPVVVDEFLASSTYFDPLDQCLSLEHHFQLAMVFRYLQRGVHMSTWTWDPGLQWRLDYFSMVACIPTWDPGSLVYFRTMVHTYPWDPGIWLYTLIASVEDNTFIRGMEC
jgi:hypothetical protein